MPSTPDEAGAKSVLLLKRFEGVIRHVVSGYIQQAKAKYNDDVVLTAGSADALFTRFSNLVNEFADKLYPYGDERVEYQLCSLLELSAIQVSPIVSSSLYGKNLFAANATFADCLAAEVIVNNSDHRCLDKYNCHIEQANKDLSNVVTEHRIMLASIAFSPAHEQLERFPFYTNNVYWELASLMYQMVRSLNLAAYHGNRAINDSGSQVSIDIEAELRKINIEKALKGYQNYLDDTNVKNYTLQPEAAKSITIEYFAQIQKYYKDKRYVKSRAEVSKVAAGTTMAVLRLMPFQSTTPSLAHQLNVDFAYYLSQAIASSIYKWSQIDDFCLSNKQFEDYLNSAFNSQLEAINYIAELQRNGHLRFTPITSQAQCWKMLDFIFRFGNRLNTEP